MKLTGKLLHEYLKCQGIASNMRTRKNLLLKLDGDSVAEASAYGESKDDHISLAISEIHSQVTQKNLIKPFGNLHIVAGLYYQPATEGSNAIVWKILTIDEVVEEEASVYYLYPDGSEGEVGGEPRSELEDHEFRGGYFGKEF